MRDDKRRGGTCVPPRGEFGQNHCCEETLSAVVRTSWVPLSRWILRVVEESTVLFCAALEEERVTPGSPLTL